MKLEGQVRKFFNILEKKGPLDATHAVLLKIGRKVRDIVPYYYYKFFKNYRKFTFNGKEYAYFYHMHTKTWANDRSVEVPIIMKIYKAYEGKKILEIGNVLQNFTAPHHDIVDLYEQDPNVINVDIVDYNPGKQYDLIFSISTMEHIGYDEDPLGINNLNDEQKLMQAFKKINELLKKNGLFIFTFPLNHNPYLLNNIEKRKVKVDNVYFMKKIPKTFDWIQVSKQEALKYKGDKDNHILAIPFYTKKS